MTNSMMSVSFDAPPAAEGALSITYPIVFTTEKRDAGDAGDETGR